MSVRIKKLKKTHPVPNQGSILSFFKKSSKCNLVESANFDSKDVFRKNEPRFTAKKRRKDNINLSSKYFPAKTDNEDDDVMVIEEFLTVASTTSNTSAEYTTQPTKKAEHTIEDKEEKTAATVPLSISESLKTSTETAVSAETAVEDTKLADGSEDTLSQRYYHKHFLHVLKSVLADEENIPLFNEDDKKIINLFSSLTVQEQNLYIRLFQRKHKWLRPMNMKYPEISKGLSNILKSLVECGFLLDEQELPDMESALCLLLLPELKMLSKHFGIGVNAKGKQQIIDAFLLHCQQQGTINRFFNSGNIQQKIIHKIKEFIGKCFKLNSEPRKVFVRMLLLFSLTDLAEDEEDSASGGQQKKLITLLMVDKGELKFPEYKIQKVNPVFQDRESLIQYESAKQLEIDILNNYNGKCFEKSLELYLSAKHLYTIASQSGVLERESQKLSFLRRFTAGHVYVRCLNHGVDILQKLKRYDETVELLQLLLKQKLFCQTYRGHWWDRLTLIYDYHLKSSKLTLKSIRQSLGDKSLHLAHEYTLRTRAQKVIETVKKQKEKGSDSGKRKKVTKMQVDMDSVQAALDGGLPVQEAPKVTILGRLLPNSQTGFKSVFLLPSADLSSSEGEMTLLSVEELALHHYKQEGYTEGLHGEGSTIVSLFCLLFWNVIYGCSVTDVFRSPYQAWPLDLNSDMFYANRRKDFDLHFKMLRTSSDKDVLNHAAVSWEEHVGTTSLVNWDLFTGPAQIKELVQCFGMKNLLKICERLVKDFRHCRSGFPDLVVWNPVSKCVKIVEVKGPNDRLSAKQVIWLHCLLEMKIPAEVCHINAVAGKRLKR